MSGEEDEESVVFNPRESPNAAFTFELKSLTFEKLKSQLYKKWY